MDRKYEHAIKAGAIGAILILVLALFVYYMYERDQYNYWHSDAPQHYDNLCVGVMWVPIFLIALAIVAAVIGVLSVRMAGALVTSMRDAVLVSSAASIAMWCINVAILALIGGVMWITTHTKGSLLDLASLLNLVGWLFVYLAVQTCISVMGGVEEAYKRFKK